MVNFRFIAMAHSLKDLRQQPERLYQRQEQRFWGNSGRASLCVCRGGGRGEGMGRGRRGGRKETLSLIILQPHLKKWEFTRNRGLRRMLQVEEKVYAKAQR